MAAATFHQATGMTQSHGEIKVLGRHPEIRNHSMKLILKGFKVELGLSKRECNRSGMRNFGAIQASASQSSVADPVLAPSNENNSEPRKKSSKLLYSSTMLMCISKKDSFRLFVHDHNTISRIFFLTLHVGMAT